MQWQDILQQEDYENYFYFELFWKERGIHNRVTLSLALAAIALVACILLPWEPRWSAMRYIGMGWVVFSVSYLLSMFLRARDEAVKLAMSEPELGRVRWASVEEEGISLRGPVRMVLLSWEEVAAVYSWRGAYYVCCVNGSAAVLSGSGLDTTGRAQLDRWMQHKLGKCFDRRNK